MDPLIDAFCAWLSEYRGRSPLTAGIYKSYLRRLLAWAREDRAKELIDLTAEDLEYFCGIHLAKAGLSRKARCCYVSTLKQFYDWMWRKLGRQAGDSPACGLTRPLTGFKLPKRMTIDQMRAIMNLIDLDTLAGLRDAAMWMILLGGGLRVSELVGLNERSLIWSQADGNRLPDLTLKVVGKGQRERLVAMPKDAAIALRAYLACPDLAKYDRDLPGGDSVLFVHLKPRMPEHLRYGNALRISRRGVYAVLRKYGEQAGLPPELMHPHAIRHLHAVHLLEQGADLISISERLGHVSLNTTKIYLSMSDQRHRKLINTASPTLAIDTPFRALWQQLENQSKK